MPREMLSSPAMKTLSFFLLSTLFIAPLARAEIDRTDSICYSYAIDPVPNPSIPVPKCRVIGTTMYIDGVISPDHYLFELKTMYPEVDTLQLNSDGGPILNIYDLTDYIRGRGMRTHVRKGATCSSACTMVYMAGTRRTAHPEARFMFHGVNAGGRPVDMKSLCESVGIDQCGKRLLEIVDDHNASTRKMFAKYVEYGASPSLWTDYQRFPEDEKWWEHGNFTRKIDWRMRPAEAAKYDIVQEILH